MKNTKSGVWEGFLLLCCKAKAAIKGMFVSQTPVVCYVFGYGLAEVQTRLWGLESDSKDLGSYDLSMTNGHMT